MASPAASESFQQVSARLEEPDPSGSFSPPQPGCIPLTGRHVSLAGCILCGANRHWLKESGHAPPVESGPRFDGRRGGARRRWLATRLQSPAAAQATAPGEFPAYTAQRTADGKPDLNGIWQSVTTANWDLEAHSAAAGPYTEWSAPTARSREGQSVVEGGDSVPAGSAGRKRANFAQRVTPSVPGDGVEPPLGDPELKCWMPGVPRTIHAVSISNRPDARNDPDHARIQRHDAPRPHELAGGDAGGQHLLHGVVARPLEGETLVIDVTGLSDKNWLDRAGNFLTDAAHVVERLTAASPYHPVLRRPSTRTCFRAPGKSASRSIDGWSAMFS